MGTDSDVEVEWTAGWPNRARLKLLIPTLLTVVPLYGLAYWYRVWPIPVALAVSVLLGIGTGSVVSKRTYRVTSSGLEWHREWWQWVVSRRLIPWSQFDAFSVTDDAIILHRPFPALDIRCKRWDLNLNTDEADVITALQSYLDRRDS